MPVKRSTSTPPPTLLRLEAGHVLAGSQRTTGLELRPRRSSFRHLPLTRTRLLGVILLVRWPNHPFDLVDLTDLAPTNLLL